MSQIKNWELTINEPNYIKYYNKHTNMLLVVKKIDRDFVGQGNYWQVTVGGSVTRFLITHGNHIGTKKIALKLATNWMRGHPNPKISHVMGEAPTN